MSKIKLLKAERDASFISQNMTPIEPIYEQVKYKPSHHIKSKPITSLKEFDSLGAEVRDGDIIKIDTSDYYVVVFASCKFILTSMRAYNNIDNPKIIMEQEYVSASEYGVIVGNVIEDFRREKRINTATEVGGLFA